MANTGEKADDEPIVFGQYEVSKTEVFFWTPLSYALVNLKPIVPGHVLVCPHRRTERFAELTSDEVADLWLATQKVCIHVLTALKQMQISSVISKHYNATSITFALQDGPEAGQTVKHVHTHIIPRRTGDFFTNDEVYRQLEIEGRPSRSAAEMAEEAAILRALMSL